MIDNHDLTKALYCGECRLTMPITDEFDDETRDGPVHVLLLECGHSISWEKR